VDDDAPSRCPQRGTGVIGSTSGALAFLLFLLFATQVALCASASATLSAVGLDTARRVAGADVDRSDPRQLDLAERNATSSLRHRLGSMGTRARVTWQVDPQFVRLHVQVGTPGVAAQITHAVGWRTIDRTFVIAAEAPR
jgi:hypothetical protein